MKTACFPQETDCEEKKWEPGDGSATTPASTAAPDFVWSDRQKRNSTWQALDPSGHRSGPQEGLCFSLMAAQPSLTSGGIHPIQGRLATPVVSKGLPWSSIMLFPNLLPLTQSSSRSQVQSQYLVKTV